MLEIECDNCHHIFSIQESKYLRSKTGLKFCNKDCKAEAQQLGKLLNKPLLPQSTGASYRSHALRVKENKCNKCGYDKYQEMLDIDHIDSNHANNVIENLQVLCVWCHALKTRKIPLHER